MRLEFFQCFCFLALLLFITFSPGCGTPASPTAKIEMATGQVQARESAGKEFIQADTKTRLFTGSAVRTGRESAARILILPDNAVIDLEANSFFEVRAATGKIGFQDTGKAVFNVNKKNTEVIIETRHGNTTVLGTKFGQMVSTDSFELFVKEGKVEFASKSGEKRQLEGGEKLIWKVSDSLPEKQVASVVEIEMFLQNSNTPYEFNRR